MPLLDFVIIVIMFLSDSSVVLLIPLSINANDSFLQFSCPFDLCVVWLLQSIHSSQAMPTQNTTNPIVENKEKTKICCHVYLRQYSVSTKHFAAIQMGDSTQLLHLFAYNKHNLHPSDGCHIVCVSYYTWSTYWNKRSFIGQACYILQAIHYLFPEHVIIICILK
eukprot:Gregarina_sp_Poly_1__5818@NODE_3064_length_1412_cov_17_866171_g1941_i0_p1_GENE_NODE_3064_length_1412_cov_17_866171_g1941_i0NODE_3064_length_1412_cov_17_866171_g1941_i0_p1_ORF_typecomplete_len165_score1_61_NODE_3064_length_1412_cov_17_866171_g1941_i07281222